MARASQGHGSSLAKRLSLSLLVSVSTLMAMCSKKASQISRKLIKAKPKSSRFMPKLPLRCPGKQVFITKITRRNKKKAAYGEEDGNEVAGDGGVWRRTILMGDRCQPLNFSGVIYYDENGNRLDQLPPRSPRRPASPLPGYLTNAFK
ncbi:uncharacterized protein LOC115734734 [Rhodamnia argentea]|uniref:Uncharacterized protein LOC115734734 n=1 Tax=Rhodamnia argentea TaxID=178133 RepID=A0A8B8NHG0_9MYRT|nr:uncharacterized protein LOC115734734 [Rhodamnia argentea]